MIRLDEILRDILKEEVSQEAIIDAIDNKQIVRINYDEDLNPSSSDQWHRPEPPMSDPKGQRTIEPYALGYTKAGNLVLRAFQPSTHTRRGNPKWKYFRVDRITSWTPTKHTFETEPKDHGYAAEDYNNLGDDLMTSVIAQVHFDDMSDIDKIKAHTNSIANAPKISTTNSSGPIQAHQQRKKNVYTSQPNSKKYQMYQQNIKDTEKEVNRFDDDIWAQAERERDAQNSINKSGPIKGRDYDEEDIFLNNDED